MVTTTTTKTVAIVALGAGAETAEVKEVIVHPGMTVRQVLDKIDLAILKHYPDLNPDQRAIVGHLDGPLLVIAGPGSGKTYSIVLRALNLLLLGKAEPKQLVLCTFTEKAIHVGWGSFYTLQLHSMYKWPRYRFRIIPSYRIQINAWLYWQLGRYMMNLDYGIVRVAI